MFDIAVSPMSYLKSPMILIAIVGMGMMFGMPYLLDSSKFFLSSSPLKYMLMIIQWTRKLDKSLRKPRNQAPLPALRVRRTRCKDLIWPLGWQGQERSIRVLLWRKGLGRGIGRGDDIRLQWSTIDTAS